MEWKLDDSRPIWMQLEEQLTRRILSGWYKAGEKLPTVRDLAAEAGVNPNTMQRALAALDGEGLSIPNRTIGRTVTEDEGVLEAMRSRLAGNIIDQFFEATAELGYSKEQAVSGSAQEIRQKRSSLRCESETGKWKDRGSVRTQWIR